MVINIRILCHYILAWSLCERCLIFKYEINKFSCSLMLTCVVQSVTSGLSLSLLQFQI
jgi:hypothetical protein